jgi:conjugative transposon TraM protein
MAINFKQPKYVLPLVALPFLCLFFYVYHSNAAKNKKQVKQQAGINTSVGDVSPDIKKKNLSDKLDAYRSAYKEADGYTAVNPIPSEQNSGPAFHNSYSDQQKRMLDSIDQEMKRRYGSRPAQAVPQKSYTGSFTGPGSSLRGTSPQDKALQSALANLANRQKESAANHPGLGASVKDKDPMEIFKQQMAYMDSINKSNDPAYKAEKLKQQAIAKANAEKAKEPTLEVRKAALPPDDFNTVMPERPEAFIMAIIDENVTGYAGSRIRLRLLEDITAGQTLIKKGTYLYALINGFSGQRVTLQIKSILYNDKELPVKLDVYDLDGLPGLYVPASQFRDFTKDLGTNTIQGVSIDGNAQNGSQLLMSSADKIFQSTSTAIASAIRKNKAKIKYNSYIYLIDTKAQEKAQN